MTIQEAFNAGRLYTLGGLLVTDSNALKGTRPWHFIIKDEAKAPASVATTDNVINPYESFKAQQANAYKGGK